MCSRLCRLSRGGLGYWRPQCCGAGPHPSGLRPALRVFGFGLWRQRSPLSGWERGGASHLRSFRFVLATAAAPAPWASAAARIRSGVFAPTVVPPVVQGNRALQPTCFSTHPLPYGFCPPLRPSTSFLLVPRLFCDACRAVLASGHGQLYKQGCHIDCRVARARPGGQWTSAWVSTLSPSCRPSATDMLRPGCTGFSTSRLWDAPRLRSRRR